MKKQFILPLAVLAAMGLSACGGDTTSSVSPSLPSSEKDSSVISSPESSSQAPSSTVDSSNTSSSSADSSNNSSSTPDPIIVEVDKKYAVTTTAGEGTTITIETELEEGKAIAGTEIVFSVSLTDNTRELVSVVAGDKTLNAESDGKYHFTMLNKDVSIVTTTASLGDKAIIEDKEVDVSNIPTTPSQVQALLVAESEIEGKYFSSGTYRHESSGNLETSFDYVITSGRENVLSIRGNRIPDDNASYSSSAYIERGLDERGYYYEYDSSTSLSSSDTSGEATDKLNVSRIVEEVTESSGQITAKDADKKVASYGFADVLLGYGFGTDGSFLDTGSDGWKNIQISSSLAEDKKSFTVNLSAIEESYVLSNIIKMSLTFDGVGFLTNAEYSSYTYDNVYLDDETKLPVENAEVNSYISDTITAVRGFKKDIQKEIENLDDYAMEDYDVVVTYMISGETYVAEDNIVENGSELNFRYRSKDLDKKVLIKPTFVGIAEEDSEMAGFDQYNDFMVHGEGTFTLIFDNGLGLRKEIEVTSVRPNPKSISATLSANTIFVGGTATLTVSIDPEEADQSVEVKVNDEELASVEEGENPGEYLVTGLAEGEVEITVTSTVVPTLSRTVTLTINEKPSAEVVRETITTKTLAFVDYYESYYINFNADGTGTFRVNQYYSYENVGTFNWTLDDETLVFEIETTDYDQTKLKAFTVLTNTSFKATFEGFYSDTDYNVTPQDRIEDLSTLR